jgi:hypothetical protein
MKHAFIAPINYLDLIPDECTFHLVLAHLLDNKNYVDFYNKRKAKGDFIILDNSCFEYKKPLSLEKILHFLDQHDAQVDVLVASDYPFEPWQKTVKAADQFKNDLVKKNLSYQVMVVPQSEKGDVCGWLQGYKELSNLGVSFIGMSIMGLPNAFRTVTYTDDISTNRLYASLYLKNHGLITETVKHHYLGLGSNVRELLLLAQMGVAYSNDSSSAFWHGINGITYDRSGSGLQQGKIEKPVDFFIARNKSVEKLIKHNINFITGLLENENEKHQIPAIL